MRNLKRALSLTLASVMLLGMMVVGSSAVAGYDDVAETDNVEAIEVLQTIEVMVGDERGFGPERPVNRAEMAVVMGKLLSLDYNYYSATCPFNDVYDWARGWVGACAANGIVSGRGDGVYDPGATVTAVEAASMLMRALGYFKYSNDYADGFEVSTVRQGTLIGIFDGVGSSATEPMTRNQVAQMVLNALQTGTVQPDGNTINLTTPDGSVYTGKVNYVYVTSNKTFAQAISGVAASSMGSANDDPIVELGEQLYNGELKLYGVKEGDRRTDDFGRPARIWEYKGKEIGTYVKKELLKAEYTTKVTGQTLYELLTRNTVEDYRFRIYIDGVETTEANKAILNAANSSSPWFDKNDLYRTNKDGVGGTGKGVLTQVYVDTDYIDPVNYTVYINVINTYLAIAKEDYNAKDDNVDLDVYAITDDGHANIYVKSNPDDGAGVNKLKDITEIMTLDGDEFSIKDVKDGDKFLVNVAEGRVQIISAPEVISKATINAFSRLDWITLDGTQYDYASTARYDVDVLYRYDNPNLKDVTYNVVLDKYGYAIGLERNEDPDQYVFLTGIEQGYSNLAARNVDANIIHVDGTMETVTVDTRESELPYFDEPSQANTWCTFRVDSKGIYTLSEVPSSIVDPSDSDITYDAAQWHTDIKAGDDERVIDNKHITMPSGPSTVTYGDDNSVYINVSTDHIYVDRPNANPRLIIDDVDSVSTGHRNVNISVPNCVDYIDTNNTPDNPVDDIRFLAPAEEIYTLFNDDNYIIAMVTIGVDEGTSSNWVYVTSATGKAGVKSEAYNGDSTRAANDGLWTWTREVISNGKKTDITEVNKNLKYLDKMTRGEWYEVKYDANGNVRTEPKLLVTSDHYIDKVADVEAKVNQKDKVLLQQRVIASEIYFDKTGTLWVLDEVKTGFPVSPDVKVALILANKSGATYKTIDDCDTYSKYDGLKRAIDDMNVWYDSAYADKWAYVELSAVIEGDSATSIIIRDDNPAPDNRPTSGSSVGVSGLTVSFDMSDYTNAKFYVNNKPVNMSEDVVYAGGGLYSFKVEKGQKVEVYGTSLFTNVKKAGSIEIDGVTYNATANQSSVNFEVGTKSIVLPAPADIKIAADAGTPTTGAIDDQFTKVTVVLKQTGKDDVTLDATAAHIVADSTEAAKAPYKDVSTACVADDLYLGFTVPTGVKFSADSATVDFVVDGKTYTGVATVHAADVGVMKVDNTNVPKAVAAGGSTEITINLTVTSNKPVEVILPAGYTALYSDSAGTATTEDLSTSTGTAIQIQFSNVDENEIMELKVKYTLSGTDNDVTEATLMTGSAVSPSSGVVTISDLTNGTPKASADAEKVVVTITEIVPTKVLGKIDLASGVKSTITGATAATGSGELAYSTGYAENDTLDFVTNKVAGFTLASGVARAEVKYTLSGVTENGDSQATKVDGTGYIVDDTLTMYKDGTTTDATGTDATFKVTCDGPIVLTITEVTDTITNNVQLTYAGDCAGDIDLTDANTNKNTVAKNAGKVEFVIKSASIPTGAETVRVSYTVNSDGLIGVAQNYADLDVSASRKVTISGTVANDITVTVTDITVTEWVVTPTGGTTATGGVTANNTAVKVDVAKSGSSYIVTNAKLDALLQSYIVDTSEVDNANGVTIKFAFGGATLSTTGTQEVSFDVADNADADAIKAAITEALAGRYLEKLDGDITITITLTAK